MEWNIKEYCPKAFVPTDTAVCSCPFRSLHLRHCKWKSSIQWPRLLLVSEHPVWDIQAPALLFSSLVSSLLPSLSLLLSAFISSVLYQQERAAQGILLCLAWRVNRGRLIRPMDWYSCYMFQVLQWASHMSTFVPLQLAFHWKWIQKFLPASVHIPPSDKTAEGSLHPFKSMQLFSWNDILVKGTCNPIILLSF